MPPSRTLKLNPFITIWVEWVEKIGPKVWRKVSEEYLEALYASWLGRMEALVAVGGSHTKYWRIFDYFVTTLWINELFAQVTEYSFYVFPFFGQWLQRGQWPMPSDIGGFFPSPPPSSPSSSPSIPLSLGSKLISKLGGSNLILQKIPLCAAPLTAITTTTNYRGATGTVDHLHFCDFSIYSHFLTKTAKTSH